MWHIVYLSFESSPSGRNYIGKHSTTNLNDGYLGSFTDETFRPEFRLVLGYYKTSEAAIAAEIQWQKVFQVATDPQFANRTYQTSTGFKCVGHSEISRQKMSEKRSGENNPMFGKTGGLAPATHMHWFFNPKTHEERYARECPQGWIPGRPSVGLAAQTREILQSTRDKLRNYQLSVPKEDRYWFGKEGNASGTFWWRNPETGKTKRSKTQPGPTWIQGRK